MVDLSKVASRLEQERMRNPGERDDAEEAGKDLLAAEREDAAARAARVAEAEEGAGDD